MKRRNPCYLIGMVMLALICVSTQSSAKEKEEHTNTIPEHILICGEDVSGMTKKEAEQVVADYLAQYNDVKFTLKAEDKSITANAKDLSLKAKNEDVVSRAMNYGKEGTLIERYKANKDMEKGKEKDFSITMTTDTATVKQYLETHKGEICTEAIDNGLELKDGQFTYVEGTEGVELLVDKSASAITNYVATKWDGKDITLDLYTQKDKPKGTKEELEKVKDVLGTFTTDFSTSGNARSTNVRNGARLIDGHIVYPGETFSVEKTCSPFSLENGYAEAEAFENGSTVPSIGGGICQVSSTLYNAVMRSELEIVTRAAHSMIVNYVEPSMDAAIASGIKDFQFKNNTNAPVYLEGYTKGKTITFTVYGQETRDPGRKVEFISEVTSQTDPVVEFKAAPDQPIGYVQKTQSAHIGYTAKLWKIVTQDGVEIERRVYNNSKYTPSNEVVSVGTMSGNPEAVAAMNAAIATQDDATIRGAAANWNDAAVSARQNSPSATTPTVVPTVPEAIAPTPSTPVTPTTPTTPTTPSDAVTDNTVLPNQTEGTQ